MTDHIQIKNIPPRIQYQADGIIKEFSYSFSIFKADDMTVYLDDEKQTTGYQVTGAGKTNGGTVVFTKAPKDGVVVTLLRELDIERLSDFQDNSTLRATTLNNEFDYQIACMQQVADNLNRSLVLKPYAQAVDMTLPSPKANKAIIWNAQGTALENSEIEINALTENFLSLQEQVETDCETVVEKAAQVTTLAQQVNQQASEVELNVNKSPGLPLLSVVWKENPDIDEGLVPLFTPGGYFLSNVDQAFPNAWAKLVEFKGKAATDSTYARYNKTQAEYDAELAAKGFCGFYVIDQTNKTLRLPCYTDAFLRTMATGHDIDELDQIQNITGQFTLDGTTSYRSPVTTGAFSASGTTPGCSHQAYSGNDSPNILFNASTVARTGTYTRPKSIAGYPFLVLYNSVRPAAPVQQAAFFANLSQKADVTLSNIAPGLLSTLTCTRKWTQTFSFPTFDQILTINHNLNISPLDMRVKLYLKVLTANNGWAAGDIMDFPLAGKTDIPNVSYVGCGCGCHYDNNNIMIHFPSVEIYAWKKTNGSVFTITNSNRANFQGIVVIYY